MKVFLSALVLCVLQCQVEAGRRPIKLNNHDKVSIKGQISTDAAITTPNRPGLIVRGGGKVRQYDSLPDGVELGPDFSRSRNRNSPYGYGRQDSLDNIFTPNDGKRRNDDGYPPDDPDITRYRYPWNPYSGYGRQETDDVVAAPVGDPYVYPWKPPKGYGKQGFPPGDMTPPYAARKRRRDDLYPPDVIDPQLPFGRTRYSPYGYARQDPFDMITSTVGGFRKTPRDDMYPPDVAIDPRSTRYSRLSNQPNVVPGRQVYSPEDMNTSPNRPWDTRTRIMSGKQVYSPEDMNTSPNRPWDIRTRSKRNFARIPLLRDNKMTSYLIAKLKQMKDMFEYYEWESLAAMVGQWIVSLKEQQMDLAAEAPPAGPGSPQDTAAVQLPPDDDDQYYPYGKNSRQEMTPGEPCGPYDTRPFCLGL